MKLSGRGVLGVAVATLLAGTVAYSCKIRRVDSDPEPPARPASVPSTAIWAGGVDGGSFILLEPTKKPDQYVAKIYDESVGEVTFDGVLQLNQQTAAPLDVRSAKTFSFWDGDTLYLTDGRSLSPIGR
jgi:hypothetical protein